MPFVTAISDASRPFPISKLVPLSLAASYSATAEVIAGATLNLLSHSSETLANRSLSSLCVRSPTSILMRSHYLTQVEIYVTTADFYLPLDPRPLIVFVDGRVHLKMRRMIKDEELRTLLRKRGYKILE